MSSTMTQVANQALISIEVNPINNLDEPAIPSNASSPNTSAVSILNVVKEDVLKFIQSKSRWSSLYKEETLTLVHEPDGIDYFAYVYQLPGDVLAFTELRSGEVFDIRGKYLYTADSSAVLLYGKYSTTPSEWNSFLTDAVWSEWAARVAPKLAPKKAMDARQLADRTLLDAASSDFMNRQSPIERDAFFGLNQARIYRGRYSGTGRASRLRQPMNGYNRGTF